MTEHPQSGRHPLARTARSVRPAALCCLAYALLLAVTGCSIGQGANTGSADASPTVGARMAGPAVDVNITPEALASQPKPWVLTTPESAVRSYLDWTTYAYRIGQSQFATSTMTPYEEVRVDSFVQYNIQQSRLMDQTLDSITFGTASVGSTSALVPAKESWTYRYVSIDVGNRVIGGPYKAAYDSTYTVVKTESGDWVVDSVEAKALDEVK